MFGEKSFSNYTAEKSLNHIDLKFLRSIKIWLYGTVANICNACLSIKNNEQNSQPPENILSKGINAVKDVLVGNGDDNTQKEIGKSSINPKGKQNMSQKSNKLFNNQKKNLPTTQNTKQKNNSSISDIQQRRMIEHQQNLLKSS